jgi:tetratricopeptide (TPR) repeat protein
MSTFQILGDEGDDLGPPTPRVRDQAPGDRARVLRRVVFYRKALEIEATQPEAQYNLGDVMLERGHAAEAVSFFCGAISSDPRFADVYFNLAMAYE